MKIEIVHASIAETGTINGKAGDQTGAEVCLRELYDRGWTTICRPKSAFFASQIKVAAVEASDNPMIGYSQGDRYSLLDYIDDNDCISFEEVDTPVNCDCSSLITAVLDICDVYISRNMWTGSEVEELEETCKFDILPYSEKLMVGDILVAPGHTAIVVYVEGTTLKAEYADIFDPEKAGGYSPIDIVNIRSGAGLDKPIMATACPLDLLTNYGYYSLDSRGVAWLLVKRATDGLIGFVSSNVVHKPIGGAHE